MEKETAPAAVRYSDSDKYERILLGGEVPPEYEGSFRIGVKCNSPNSICELTVYRVHNSRYEILFGCTGAIGKNGAGKTAEGDLKTPYGTFAVGNAYGIQANPGSVIPYTIITEDMYWRCNPAKSDYNKLVCKSELPADTDFSKDEHMINYGSAYNYLLDIGYNRDCVPYCGSAVFLHCRDNKNTATGGCIAVSEEYMIKILRTITPGTHITIY